MKTAVMIALAVIFLTQNEQIVLSIKIISCNDFICLVSKGLIHNFSNTLNIVSIQITALYNRSLNEIHTFL